VFSLRERNRIKRKTEISINEFGLTYVKEIQSLYTCLQFAYAKKEKKFSDPNTLQNSLYILPFEQGNNNHYDIQNKYLHTNQMDQKKTVNNFNQVLNAVSISSNWAMLLMVGLD
jgi:hypothetical protein